MWVDLRTLKVPPANADSLSPMTQFSGHFKADMHFAQPGIVALTACPWLSSSRAGGVRQEVALAGEFSPAARLHAAGAAAAGRKSITPPDSRRRYGELIRLSLFGRKLGRALRP